MWCKSPRTSLTYVNLLTVLQSNRCTCVRSTHSNQDNSLSLKTTRLKSYTTQYTFDIEIQSMSGLEAPSSYAVVPPFDKQEMGCIF